MSETSDAIVREWLEHARSDLNAAQVLCASLDVLPEQACFHAQQAVEKALKAVLINRQAQFPRTHQIEPLLTLLSNSDVVLEDWMRELDELTDYAVESRYPGFFEETTAADCEKAILLARRTLGWAESIVNA